MQQEAQVLSDIAMDLGVNTSLPLPVDLNLSETMNCATCKKDFKASDEGCSSMTLMCSKCMKRFDAGLETLESDDMEGNISQNKQCFCIHALTYSLIVDDCLTIQQHEEKTPVLSDSSVKEVSDTSGNEVDDDEPHEEKDGNGIDNDKDGNGVDIDKDGNGIDIDKDGNGIDNDKDGNDIDGNHKDGDDSDSDSDADTDVDDTDVVSSRSVSSVSMASGLSHQQLTPQEDGSIDVKIALLNIMNEKDHSDVITINGVTHLMEFDNLPNPDGRGLKTWMFNSDFSSTIPPLYWYRFYGAYVTKKMAFIGMCMTECGNLLVGILETRCNRPRYDAVIYYKRSNECKIQKEISWKKKLVLRPNIELGVNLDHVKR